MKKVDRVLYGVDLRLGKTSFSLYSNLCILKLELVEPLWELWGVWSSWELSGVC